MLRITADAFHEKLTLQGKEEIILNGTPDDLRGTMRISNPGDQPLKVRSLPLQSGNKMWGDPHVLQLSARLRPGEEQQIPVSHRIPATTPPGTYEQQLMVGGEHRTVRLVVQEHIDLDLHPLQFTFRGTEPGKTHMMLITATNRGNVPFVIPELKHVAALDMDMLCSAFGMAMRNPKSEGYEAVLNDLARNIRGTLPEWAEAKVRDAGTTIAPGETRLISIALTIPKDSKAHKDYSGSMRFWDKEISYAIKGDGRVVVDKAPPDTRPGPEPKPVVQAEPVRPGPIAVSGKGADQKGNTEKPK